MIKLLEKSFLAESRFYFKRDIGAIRCRKLFKYQERWLYNIIYYRELSIFLFKNQRVFDVWLQRQELSVYYDNQI